MRFEPSKNGQKTKIWYAQEFTDPCRIVRWDSYVPAIRREVSELDEQASAKVITHLVEQGIQPFITMSQYLPFDLITVMPDMKILKRVRVGWGQVEATHYADQYAIYHPTTNQCAIYEANALPPDLKWMNTVAMSIGMSEVAG